MLVVVLLALLSGAAPDQGPWWSNAVYYRVHVDSFKDMDGDGLGDLPATAKQLSYVKSLGVDAVILSSISEKSKDCSKPGILSFADIDQRYGSLNSFGALLQKANKLELKIIVSLDLRTISSDSEWFKSSASREKGFEDRLVWTVGDADLVPQPREGMDLWVWNEDRKAYWASSSNETLLNLCSENVATALTNVQCTWINRGVSGFLYSPDFPMNDECDVQLVKKLVIEGRSCARAASLDTPVILVETVLRAETAAKYYGEGDVGAHTVITHALATPARPPAPELALALHAALLVAPPDARPAWLTSQTGNSRTTTRYGADMVDSVNLLALILPGAAVIQQGDELGAADSILEWASNNTCWPGKIVPSAAPFPWDDSPKGGFTNGEPWLPLAPNYRYANAKTEYANDLSHVSVLRAAAAMRKTPAIGPHVEIKRLGNILAILRWGGSGSLLYVSNFGKSTSEAQLSRLPGLPAEMTVATSSGGSSLPPATHVTTEKGVRLGPGETVLLVGAPRHCSGPGPVDKIANKLTEGWQKVNKYFSNL